MFPDRSYCPAPPSYLASQPASLGLWWDAPGFSRLTATPEAAAHSPDVPVPGLSLFVETLLESRDSWEADAKDARDSHARLLAGETDTTEEMAAGKCCCCCCCNGQGLRRWGPLIVWVTFGSLFGGVGQGWDFATCLYFAVTAISTAGLEAIDIPDPSQESFNVFLCGLYTFFGVPIFGASPPSCAGSESRASTADLSVCSLGCRTSCYGPLFVTLSLFAPRD